MLEKIEFLDDILASKEASAYAKKMRTKVTGSKAGIITVREDPKGLRRIKVVFPDAPGVNSHWIRRAESTLGVDTPVPKLGQMVIVDFVEGDRTKGYYRVAQNNLNRPVNTEAPLDDYTVTVPADYNLSATKNINEGAKDNINVSAGREIVQQANEKITIKTNNETVITVDADGAVRISSTRIVLDADNITLNADNVNVEADIIQMNAASATLGGKEIATVGAIDIKAHPLITRGW